MHELLQAAMEAMKVMTTMMLTRKLKLMASEMALAQDHH
jgi:hypothetical protein